MSNKSGSVTALMRLMAMMLVLGAGVCAMLADRHKPDPAVREAARHYYLRGAQSEAEGDFDKAFEFYRKAHALDPSYEDASYSYGVGRLALRQDTFRSPAEIRRSLALMRPLLDAYPADVNIHETYALAAVQGDTLDEAIRAYDIAVKNHPGKSELYIPMSVIYMRRGDLEHALHAISEYERLEGVSTETVMRKASCYLMKEDTVAALGEFAAFMETNRNNPEALVGSAMVYNALAQPDSARSILEDAARRFPDNGDIKFELAMLSIEHADTAAFHANMAAALESDDLDDEDRIEMLGQYVEKLPVDAPADAYRESDAIFNSMEPLYPADIAFLNLLGGYRMRKGDYAGATEANRKAFDLDKADAYLLRQLIGSSVLADKPLDGVRAFEEYTGPDAKNPALALTYITAAQIGEDYDRALAWSDTILASPVAATDEIASMFHEIKGDIYSKMKRQADAVASYRKALELNPENASALNNFAYYLVETVKVAPGSPEFEEAKTMSRTSLELTSEEPNDTYYDTYAWILFKEQNYKDAITYQEYALELAGADVAAEMLSHYGDMLFMAGRPDEAIEQWRKALEIDPYDALLKKKIEHKTFFYE